MKKGKSMLLLLLLLAVTAGLCYTAYFGLPWGDKHYLGVQNIKQGLDLSGGVSITYEAEKDKVTEDEMSSAVAMIRGRLDRQNWTEAEVAKEGEKRIRVDIPGVEDAETAITEIGQTAQLSFQDMEGNVLITGDKVKNAKMNMGAMNEGEVAQPYVSLEFNEEGTQLFADATAANLGKQIAIVLDNSTVSAPTVNSEIRDGNAMITGSFTKEEAENLAALIRAGSLPFNLKVLEMNNVGAKLGANALSTSVLAGAIGMGLVLLFMLFVYRVPGFASDWALVAYLSIELIVLSLFQVTVTLPGIAGIVLSIGMAVDANIIIFERLKEEMRMGKTLRSAVDNSFKRALPAILDGNVTTLIAAVVLYWIGSGPIKGFAQTLGLGIVISMFSALVITKVILKGLISSGIHNPKWYAAKAK